MPCEHSSPRAGLISTAANASAPRPQFRRSRRLRLRHSTWVVFLCALARLAPAQVSVLTQHNDNSRTGENTSETQLTTASVTAAQFGKLFALPVDGQVYAQPLYVANITIAGMPHNVLIVATENDSVYAFDADSSTGINASPLWKASLVDAAHGAGPGESPVTSAQVSCTDLQPLIGITSTPVIDATSNTLYLEAKSSDGTNFFHRLHALDLFTGNEKFSGPARIAATVPGTGDGSSGSQLTFDDLTHNSRPGLLLLNGSIYLGYASHCDNGPYHGWMFAYDAATLAQQSVFVSTLNGGLGGFWQSGAGIAADSASHLFIATGNGSFDGKTEFSDSILKLGTTQAQLSLLDYFTPFDQAQLNSNDTDLGSGGVLLLPDQPGPHPHLLVQAGKEGTIYVLNRDQLTTNNLHYCPAPGCSSDPEILEEDLGGLSGGMWSMPAYWNNTIYFWPSGGNLTSLPITRGLPDFTALATGTLALGFPGATPSISSNGNSAGSAILWAIDSSQYGPPAQSVAGPAVVYAFAATSITAELWDSTQAAGQRDQAGNAVKFAVPTIASGKVYVGTSAEVDVYGLLKRVTATAVGSSLNPSLFGQSVTFTATVTSSAGTPAGTATFYDGTTALAAVALSAGKAGFATTALAAGSHSIAAVYGGSSNFNSSASSQVTQIVDQAPTTTAISSSANPSSVGEAVTLTATVASTVSGVTPGGMVSFCDGAVSAGPPATCAGATLGTSALNGAGVATLTTAALAAGSHTLNALYAGSGDFNSSDSAAAALIQVVNVGATTNTQLVVAETPAYLPATQALFRHQLTLTATVTSAAGTPVGTVTFSDKGVALGAPVLLSAGKSTLTVTFGAIGKHLILATYSGSANFTTSTSSGFTLYRSPKPH